MREMLSIVPRCIGPATMRVDGSLSLPVLKSNMRIRLRHLSGVPLFLEEIDDIGKRVLFQELLLDRERIRTNAALVARALEIELAFTGDRIEIDRPEIPVAPLLYLTGGLCRSRENFPAIRLCFQRALGDGIARMSEDDGMLGAGGFVPKMIRQDLRSGGKSVTGKECRSKYENWQAHDSLNRSNR